jgi:hypothetical protein
VTGDIRYIFFTVVEPQVPSTWNIALSAWVIQDGNYPDFTAGQVAEFAVEFYQKRGTRIEECESGGSARMLDDSTYEVRAEKVADTGGATVIDIGIFAYCHNISLPFAELRTGQRFRTELHLNVDPFHNFELGGQNGETYPLVYSWRIRSILRQTAPFIEVSSGSRMRDPSKHGYEEISRTDAWKDDDGHGEYILRCDLLSTDPKGESATAINV